MKWSLEEWLQMTRGRSATDNRDFANAGLALIRKASLMIDQSLQLENSVSTSQSGPRLWPQIHAAADVDKFEVFLKLAACFLTQSQSVRIRLVSWASRERFDVTDLGARAGVIECKLYRASWLSERDEFQDLHNVSCVTQDFP